MVYPCSLNPKTPSWDGCMAGGDPFFEAAWYTVQLAHCCVSLLSGRRRDIKSPILPGWVQLNRFNGTNDLIPCQQPFGKYSRCWVSSSTEKSAVKIRYSAVLLVLAFNKWNNGSDRWLCFTRSQVFNIVGPVLWNSLMPETRQASLPCCMSGT